MIHVYYLLLVETSRRMGSSAPKSTTGSSKLKKAVPPGERVRILDNELLDHQQSHIPIDGEVIDYVRRRIYVALGLY